MSATALKSTNWQFSSKPNLDFFGLVPKSSTHTGLICVKPWSRISQAWAPLRSRIGLSNNTLKVRYTIAREAGIL